jgi:hypothetical protein
MSTILSVFRPRTPAGRDNLLLALMVVSLSACSSSAPGTADAEPAAGDADHPAWLGYPPAGQQHLRGHFLFGNELHAFQSCGLPALTWVDLQGREPGIHKLDGLGETCQVDDAGAPQCEVRFIYVELDATVLGPCPGAPVGHLGKYECSLRVDALLTASASSPPDCPQAPPAYP